MTDKKENNLIADFRDSNTLDLKKVNCPNDEKEVNCTNDKASYGSSEWRNSEEDEYLGKHQSVKLDPKETTGRNFDHYRIDEQFFILLRENVL